MGHLTPQGKKAFQDYGSPAIKSQELAERVLLPNVVIRETNDEAKSTKSIKFMTAWQRRKTQVTSQRSYCRIPNPEIVIRRKILQELPPFQLELMS